MHEGSASEDRLGVAVVFAEVGREAGIAAAFRMWAECARPMSDIERQTAPVNGVRQRSFVPGRLRLEFVEQVDVALPNIGRGQVEAGFVRPSLQHNQ